MKKTYTLYSKIRGFYKSREPGNFAAITTQKIAGRLDCHSGKRAKPENRIFLEYLEDMPKGFRPCKICKPEILQVKDSLYCSEKRAIALKHKPHISLWALGILINEHTYEPRRWYVAMNWDDTDDEWFTKQVTPSAVHRYHQAFSLSLKEGKRLNLPVIKHDIMGFVILWLPTEKSTPEQKQLVECYHDGSITSIFGPLG
ncbi:MAG: Ada metal-binding domain-containing protein [bacterium]|nr:Ada metal-binding domain-containing protein [bacterium]